MTPHASEPNAVLGALALVDGYYELESNDRGSFWWTRSHFVLQKVLDTAKRNLGCFDAVGLFEEYGESCRSILRRIGRSGEAETASIPHDHRGICRDDGKVSEQARELIREKNHLDIALYEWARAHLA